MAHWSFLARTPTDDPNHEITWTSDEPGVEIVLAASYMVPVLWCSAFAEQDFKTCACILPDGDTVTHPVLVTAADLGLARAGERRPTFDALFGKKMLPYYDAWLAFLEQFSGAFIHMDWDDVAMMSEPSETDEAVRAGVQAFASNQREDWGAIFPLSNVGFDPATGLATIGSDKSLTPDFKAQCLYGTHFVRQENA